MSFPVSASRSTDPNDQIWQGLGFGGKTAPETTWRWWSEAGAKGPWIISAPHGLADYRLIGKELYLEGDLVLEGKTQWDATWRALAHFYAEVAPSIEMPQTNVLRNSDFAKRVGPSLSDCQQQRLME